MDVYIMDANAIRVTSFHLLEEKRATKVLITTDEVLHEVSGRGKVSLLDVAKLGTIAFIKMRELMQYDYVKALVDYVENKGAADVSLLAHALTINEGRLIADVPHIVTDDIKLRHACNMLSICWISSKDFKVM